MSRQSSCSEYKVLGSWYADETGEALDSTRPWDNPWFRFY